MKKEKVTEEDAKKAHALYIAIAVAEHILEKVLGEDWKARKIHNPRTGKCYKIVRHTASRKPRNQIRGLWSSGKKEWEW